MELTQKHTSVQQSVTKSLGLGNNSDEDEEEIPMKKSKASKRNAVNFGDDENEGGKKGKNLIDDEASLSGDDIGSDDEVFGKDKNEPEEGNKDKNINEEELRDDLMKHQRGKGFKELLPARKVAASFIDGDFPTDPSHFQATYLPLPDHYEGTSMTWSSTEDLVEDFYSCEQIWEMEEKGTIPKTGCLLDDAWFEGLGSSADYNKPDYMAQMPLHDGDHPISDIED